MAKHQIVIRENTGATKDTAPYLGSYPDFPRSHPISTFRKRITDKMGANADRFAGYCLSKTGKFV